jgi:hypothetical protein
MAAATNDLTPRMLPQFGGMTQEHAPRPGSTLHTIQRPAPARWCSDLTSCFGPKARSGGIPEGLRHRGRVEGSAPRGSHPIGGNMWAMTV